MKKQIFVLSLFVSLSFFLVSCASTQAAADAQTTEVSPDEQADLSEDSFAQTQTDIANEIAEELNASSSTSEQDSTIYEEPTVQAEEAQDNYSPTGETSQTEDISPAKDTYLAEELSQTENISPAEESSQTEEPSEEEHSEEEPEATEPSEEQNESVANDQSEENSELVEKVSDEDSLLKKDGGEIPTTDEKNKVAEFQIFEEPEVIVLDLPEENEEIKGSPKEEENATEPLSSPIIIEENTQNQTEEQKESTESAETAQNDTTPIPPPTVPEIAEAIENPGDSEEIIEEIPVEEEKPIVPSRSVSLKINQYLDVVYPGSGWVYIGETEKAPLFNYFGRKLGTGNTTFALRAKKSGKTILHFYKNDALTGEYIDDYLEAEVQDKRETGRIKAPSYAEIIPAKPQRRIDRASENAKQESKSETEADAVTQAQGGAESTESMKNKPETTPPNANSQNPETLPDSQSTGAEDALPTAVSIPPVAPASASSPVTVTESDIKTVIQTTDEKAAAQSDSTEMENHSEERQTQFFNYIPTSSQSSAEYEAEISEEPEVIREEPVDVADESLLERAKQDFVDGKFTDALKEAQEYYNNASTRLDEALFLLGQISESNSSVRDIRFAVDSYDMLVKRFPASPLWKQAKNRSIYLKRFYIDIR